METRQIFRTYMILEKSEFQQNGHNFLKEVSDHQSEKRKLLEEISQLETKIMEVNQVLYRHSLTPSMRLQLKEDLEYHQQQIELKQQLLQQLHQGK